MGDFKLMNTFSGKGTSNAQNNKNVGEKVCVKLTEPYFDSERKRSLTADNFFSSISLANNLIKKNISFVGTLRKNKKEIPSCFLPNRKRTVFSSIFGFNKETTLVSYVPKLNKSVILLSTEHHNKKLSDIDSKPEIIEFYNSTKVILILFYFPFFLF